MAFYIICTALTCVATVTNFWHLIMYLFFKWRNITYLLTQGYGRRLLILIILRETMKRILYCFGSRAITLRIITPRINAPGYLLPDNFPLDNFPPGKLPSRLIDPRTIATLIISPQTIAPGELSPDNWYLDNCPPNNYSRITTLQIIAALS